MQSAALLRGLWNQLHEDRIRRSGSRSSRTPKLPPDGWPQARKHFAAEGPDAHGVEGLRYLDRDEARDFG